MNTAATDFIHNEQMKIDNRLFWGRIVGSSLGYLIVTLFLNSIRTTAPLWFVWVLIVIQFALYFSIFIAGYSRSKALGLNKTVALVVFVIFAVLGRINNWEIIVIPLVVVGVLVCSALKKTSPNTHTQNETQK
jgi:hypothetical protein